MNGKNTAEQAPGGASSSQRDRSLRFGAAPKRFLETSLENTPQDHIPEQNLKFIADCNKAEQIGMRLIARAEQTQKGFSLKLKRRGCEDECIQAIVEKLTELGLLNDERYAERWLRAKLSRKTGKIASPRLLSAALSSRGISREDQQSAFEKILDEEAEYSLLEYYMEKVIKLPKGYSEKSHLKYEGFSSAVINLYFDE